MGLNFVPSVEERQIDVLERIATALEELVKCKKHNQ